jgi:putative transposase
MRHRQYTVSCQDVCRWTVQNLVQALGWTVQVASVSPELLIQLLVRAAAEVRSLSAIVQEAQAAPSVETVRQALGKYLPRHPQDLLPAITQALHHRLPKSLRRRPRTMAIDWHLRPYYGRRSAPGVCRSEPKASTKFFFAYASLLVIRRGQTFTVGLTSVLPGEKQPVVIARLLAQAQPAGLQVRRLLLDRAFYGATTIQWLQQQGLAFVMPMLQRGKAGRIKATSTGTQKFFVRGRRGWDRYTWTAPRRRTGGRHTEKITITVDVCMAPRPKGRSKKKGPLVYACHLVRGAPDEIRRWYRKRFRIETSFRQLGEALAVTCSVNQVYRLLLVAIALVLRNLWVWLHWRILAEHTDQGRRPRLNLLTLRKLTYWLARRLDELLNIGTFALTT